MRLDAAGSAAYAFVEYGVEAPPPEEEVVIYPYDPNSSPLPKRAPLDPAVLRREDDEAGPGEDGRGLEKVHKAGPLPCIAEEGESSLEQGSPPPPPLGQEEGEEGASSRASDPAIVVAPPPAKLTGAQAAQAAAAAIKERLRKNKLRAEQASSAQPAAVVADGGLPEGGSGKG